METTPHAHTYHTYSYLRKYAKNLIHHDYCAYVESMTSDALADNKKFWSLINSRRKSERIPSQITYNHVHCTGPNRAALFNDYFQSNFVDSNNIVYPTIHQVIPHTLANIRTNHVEVFNLLSSLSLTKATVPNTIPNIVLKYLALPLSIPITTIFNKCFVEGKFPENWKRAHIVPVYKNKGNKSSVLSYRPISLLPPLSLLLEKIITNRLLRHVLPYLNPAQHGFIPRSSCETNLAIFLNDAVTAIRNRNELHTVYMDLSKAFDSVDHSLLLYKLAIRFSIHGSLLALLDSYLKNREQRVMLSGSTSDWLPVNSGVPQGSSLGPLCFILFMDDLAENIVNGSRVLIYADDCKILRSISSVSDARSLQLDINCLDNWCKAWKLRINPCKTVAVRYTNNKRLVDFVYTLGTENIAWVSEHNDLGVIFDNKLTFNAHIDHVVSKGMRTLGLLYRFSEIRNVRALKLFYSACVLPILLYASPIWATACQSNLVKVEKVNRFFAAIVKHRCSDFRNLSSGTILEKVQLKSISVYRELNDFKFLHNAVNGVFLNNELNALFQYRVPQFYSRSLNLLHVKAPRLALEKRSFVARLSAMYNALHDPPEFYLTKKEFLHICSTKSG